jgi:hypothetical protein
MEHVTKLLLVATAPREVLTIGFSKRSDQRVAMLVADLVALVAVTGIDCHCNDSCTSAVAPAIVGGLGLGTDGPGPGTVSFEATLRGPASFEDEKAPSSLKAVRHLSPLNWQRAGDAHRAGSAAASVPASNSEFTAEFACTC